MAAMTMARGIPLEPCRQKGARASGVARGASRCQSVLVVRNDEKRRGKGRVGPGLVAARAASCSEGRQRCAHSRRARLPPGGGLARKNDDAVAVVLNGDRREENWIKKRDGWGGVSVLFCARPSRWHLLAFAGVCLRLLASARSKTLQRQLAAHPC